jgi:hypothetical protein
MHALLAKSGRAPKPRDPAAIYSFNLFLKNL